MAARHQRPAMVRRGQYRSLWVTEDELDAVMAACLRELQINLEGRAGAIQPTPGARTHLRRRPNQEVPLSESVTIAPAIQTGPTPAAERSCDGPGRRVVRHPAAPPRTNQGGALSEEPREGVRVDPGPPRSATGSPTLERPPAQDPSLLRSAVSSARVPGAARTGHAISERPPDLSQAEEPREGAASSTQTGRAVSLTERIALIRAAAARRSGGGSGAREAARRHHAVRSHRRPARRGDGDLHDRQDRLR